MKIQIVDMNDNLVGVKERSEIDYSTDIYRGSALWLTNSKGQVLLAKRAATKDKDPGKWGPAVAGTLDEGETYKENIVKEAREEIGLSDITFTSGPKVYTSYPTKYFNQWYLASIDRVADEFTIHADEVDAVTWVDLDYLSADIQLMPEKYIPNFTKTVDIFVA